MGAGAQGSGVAAVVWPPAELSSFVGRRAELEAIAVELTRSRLLTLTGAGGCGRRLRGGSRTWWSA
jgi:hypothetical protein